MQKKLQAIWCSDAVTFFATFFLFLFLFVLLLLFFFILHCYNAIRELCTTDTRIPVLNGGILGVPFYMHVVQFMCGQIQHNIQQGIWCF